jgi:hypothetical protein
MIDFDEIWLGPRCSNDCERDWCQDNVWPRGCEQCGAKPTRYVRDKRTGRGERAVNVIVSNRAKTTV